MSEKHIKTSHFSNERDYKKSLDMQGFCSITLKQIYAAATGSLAVKDVIKAVIVRSNLRTGCEYYL